MIYFLNNMLLLKAGQMYDVFFAIGHKFYKFSRIFYKIALFKQFKEREINKVSLLKTRKERKRIFFAKKNSFSL
jgi:hypothetical protein